MSKLQEQLANLKKRYLDNVPPAFLKKTQDAARELAASGIASRVLKVNDTAPAFRLENQDNEVTSSAELLQKGPLAVTVYRGFW